MNRKNDTREFPKKLHFNRTIEDWDEEGGYFVHLGWPDKELGDVCSYENWGGKALKLCEKAPQLYNEIVDQIYYTKILIETHREKASESLISSLIIRISQMEETLRMVEGKPKNKHWTENLKFTPQ